MHAFRNLRTQRGRFDLVFSQKGSGFISGGRERRLNILMAVDSSRFCARQAKGHCPGQRDIWA